MVVVEKKGLKFLLCVEKYYTTLLLPAGGPSLRGRQRLYSCVCMLGEYLLLLLLEHIIQIHVVSEVGLDSHQMVCVYE